MAPNLIITHPSPSDRQQTWTATHPNWGAALSLQGYLDREAYLLDIPLARDGGLTHWVLTDASLPPDQRRVLSSCETLRKRTLFRAPDGEIREGSAHGVAGVFTYPELRGKGYAAKMIGLLAETLAARQKEHEGDAICSVLFSDIGKTFYAKIGWKPFESTHLAFSAATTATDEASPELRYITYDDLPSLAARDEELIRKRLSKPSRKTSVAVLPDLNTLLWHLHREDFMCKHIFSRTPSARGVLYTPPGRPDSRVWAIWARGFYGGIANPEKNTLHFLRFVVENEDGLSDDELAEAIQAIVSASRTEAMDWLCANLELWNPAERVKRLALEKNDLGGKFVVRETEEIASLNWFGEGSTDDIEWIANEKFAWC